VRARRPVEKAPKALHTKGVRLNRLARTRLDLDGTSVIFYGDGEGLRTCRDAEAAIRAVVAGKRWSCAVGNPTALDHMRIPCRRR